MSNSRDAGHGRICVVSFPMPSKLVVDIYLSRIVSILQPLCEKLYVITGNAHIKPAYQAKTELLDTRIAMRFRDEKHLKRSLITQMITILCIQAKMSYLIVKKSKEIDTLIFGMGGLNLFFPVLAAKFLRKDIAISALG